jgi:hypothetical protein
MTRFENEIGNYFAGMAEDNKVDLEDMTNDLAEQGFEITDQNILDAGFKIEKDFADDGNYWTTVVTV